MAEEWLRELALLLAKCSWYRVEWKASEGRQAPEQLLQELLHILALLPLPVCWLHSPSCESV